MQSKQEFTAQVDRLAEIKTDMDNLRAEKDMLEAAILRDALDQLKDTKYKSVTYKGKVARVTAQVAESVQVVNTDMLPLIFLETYKTMVKPVTEYKLTEPAKRLVAGVCLGGSLTNVTVADVVRGVDVDEKTTKLLLKKCKGINYQKDVAALISAGVEEKEAEATAYYLKEAALGQAFAAFLKERVPEGKEQPEEIVVKNIKRAFAASESLKIKLEV